LDEELTRKFLDMTFDCRLNHLRSAAPLYTPELSAINNALVHPILSFLNKHSKHIPLSFQLKIKLSSFQGAWTPYEARFWEFVSEAVAIELARKVDEKKNTETLLYVAETYYQDFCDWVSNMFPSKTTPDYLAIP